MMKKKLKLTKNDHRSHFNKPTNHIKWEDKDFEYLCNGDILELAKQYKPDTLYSKYSITVAKIGMEKFAQSIQAGVLVQCAGEYVLNESLYRYK